MQNKKNILIISPVVTHPINMGNKSRIVSLVKTLEEMGFNVYYLLVSKDKNTYSEMKSFWGDRLFGYDFIYRKKMSFYINKVLRSIQLFLNFKNIKPFTTDEWYDNNLDSYIEDLKSKTNFNIVIVEYIFLSKALECFDSKTLKILDTHDVFSNREKELLENGVKDLGFFTTTVEETKGLNRADVVLAIQDNEREFFSRLTKKEVITIGHITPILELNHMREKRNNILFFGGNSDINKHGLSYFIYEVLPLIKNKVKDAKLYIAGDIQLDIKTSDTIYLGKVDYTPDLYTKVDIVINPVLAGTGQKIKSMEALGAGMPLITTTAGAHGLEDGINKAFLVADTKEDFAETIIKVLEDTSLFNNLSLTSYKYIKNKNSINIQSLKNILQLIN